MSDSMLLFIESVVTVICLGVIGGVIGLLLVEFTKRNDDDE